MRKPPALIVSIKKGRRTRWFHVNDIRFSSSVGKVVLIGESNDGASVSMFIDFTQIRDALEVWSRMVSARGGNS